MSHFERLPIETIVDLLQRSLVPHEAQGLGFQEGYVVVETSSLGICQRGEAIRVDHGRIGFVSDTSEIKDGFVTVGIFDQ